MRDSPRISVIVSTHNRPDALALVLEGYSRSTFRDFEVVVADDGSEDKTAQVVDDFSRQSPFAVTQVHQPHRGFRLARVRNLAVRAARGKILLFTDGDCIPFPETLEVHAERCARLHAQVGSRALLSREETDQLLLKAKAPRDLFEPVRRREAGRLRRLAWKNRLYAWTRLKSRPKFMTANAAVHRSDFEQVNGFDERFVGWGYEDEDLARRLRRLGVRILDATAESLMLHLFHPVHESHRPDARAGDNYSYFKRGRYLTRPLKGQRPRKVEELRLELLGDVPECLTSATSSHGQAVEVSLVFGKKRRFEREEGEVLLQVPESLRVSCFSDLYRFLQENL